MANKKKIIIWTSVLAIIGVAGYLYMKNKKSKTDTTGTGDTSAAQPDAPQSNPSTGSAGQKPKTTTVPRVEPVSKYGFIVGKQLYVNPSAAKGVSIWSYPSANPKYIDRIVPVSPNPVGLFSGDSSVNGWVRVKMGGKDYYAAANKLTAVKP